MIRRLTALTAAAASLFTATVLAAPAAHAAPGDPTQVALVVDYPGGARNTFCVTYRSGMTGADVLAVASPTYGSGPYAGFVLKIGGQGTTPPTNSNYWAYWRGTSSGSFTYSGSGVTSTKPAAGSVEAWHWNSSGNTESPSGGSYASLCPGGFERAAAPTGSAPTRAASTPATAPAGSTDGGSAAATTGNRTAASSPAVSSTPGGTPGTSAAAGSGAASTPPGAATSDAGSPSMPTSVAASDVAATTSTGPGTGSTIGLIVAGLAVVGFAGVTVVARRRRAEQD